MPQILKTEVLVRLTKTWRACRAHYPGWVIAPAEAREALWSHTEYWLDYLPNSWPRMPPAQALLLLRETLWRMETALNPLYTYHVEAATAVLSRLNPAPKLLPWPTGVEEVSSDDTKPGELLEAWVEIALALLREARDDLDVGRFDEWHKRLEEAVKQQPDWLARWHYERALFALWKFDFEALETALQSWPPHFQELPFWEARRASLWAELGEFERAETLADTALQSVRERSPAGLVDYRLLSQEGWIIRLLMALKDRTRHQPGRMEEERKRKESERALFQERLADLSRHECNPWEITEWLELALKSPLPSVRPVMCEARGFDPGTVTRHGEFHRHGPMEAARPAFAMLRVFEEAALPMRVGSINFLSSEAKLVPLWIAPFAFSWALATAVRSGEEEVVDRLLDRAKIGALSPEQTKSTTSWLIKVAENALSRLDPVHAKAWDRPLWDRILPVVFESLSRLLLRSESEQAIQVVGLAEKVCRLKASQSLLGQMKHVDAVFNRAIRWVLSEEQVLKRISDWLDLPLPSEVGGADLLYRDRPEPFLYIRMRPGLQWARPDSSDVSHRIDRLLDALVNGPPLDRERASLRLVVVAWLGGLHPVEARKLREGLWSKRSPTNQFPIETSVRLQGLLHFSPLSRTEKYRLIRRTFLEQPIPRASQPKADGSGVALNYHDALNHLKKLYEVTRTVWTAREIRHDTYKWTPNEALVLLSHMVDWWKAEESHIRPKSTQYGEIFMGGIEDCIDPIVDLFAVGLLLEMRGLPREQSRPALELLDSINARGLNALRARPASIAIGGDAEAVARAVRITLLEGKPEKMRDAILAVQYWAYCAKKRFIPMLPPQVLDAVVWKVGTRMEPDLETALNLLAVLINQHAVRLSSEQNTILLNALDFLLVETQLAPDVSTAMLPPEKDERIPYVERPDHRWQAARLACSLEKDSLRRKQVVPEVISRWRETCRTSPLPELRRVWVIQDENDE